MTATRVKVRDVPYDTFSSPVLPMPSNRYPFRLHCSSLMKKPTGEMMDGKENREVNVG